VDWASFKKACPEIGVMAEERFKKDELAMLGTIRKDGSPRISPCEMDFAEDRLFLGMMWRSPKALDLLRDSRIVVHSVTCDKSGTDGDIKIYGRAVDIQDAPLRTAFREAIMARINWAPNEPDYHLFSIDVESASHVVFDEAGHEDVKVWQPDLGLRSWSKSG
jgi:hypothetical protein